MGISRSIPAMEHRPEQDERMEERQEAEVPTESGPARAEEENSSMVPESGAMELDVLPPERESSEKGPTRVSEVLTLPKVDRGPAPATPARNRPAEMSVATTPATGTRSKAERKQEKKAARKEEKRNKRAEKSARKAEKAEEVPSASKTPVQRKLDAAMENAGSIESVLLLEREYKALQHDPSHRPNFFFLIDRTISNLRYIPRTVFGPAAGEEERAKLTKLREEEGRKKQPSQKLKQKYRMKEPASRKA